jgi:hypothetical protein
MEAVEADELGEPTIVVGDRFDAGAGCCCTIIGENADYWIVVCNCANYLTHFGEWQYLKTQLLLDLRQGLSHLLQDTDIRKHDTFYGRFGQGHWRVTACQEKTFHWEAGEQGGVYDTLVAQAYIRGGQWIRMKRLMWGKLKSIQT